MPAVLRVACRSSRRRRSRASRSASRCRPDVASPAYIVMFTPRTSVPVVGVALLSGGTAIGSAAETASSSASRIAACDQRVTSDPVDQIAPTRRSPATSSALTKPLSAGSPPRRTFVDHRGDGDQAGADVPDGDVVAGDEVRRDRSAGRLPRGRRTRRARGEQVVRSHRAWCRSRRCRARSRGMPCRAVGTEEAVPCVLTEVVVAAVGVAVDVDPWRPARRGAVELSPRWMSMFAAGVDRPKDDERLGPAAAVPRPGGSRR